MAMKTEACMFCGQYQQVDDYDMTEEEIVKEATMKCGCVNAVGYKKRQQAITDARFEIKVMFPNTKEDDQDNSTVENLCSLAELIIEKRLKSANVVMPDGVKCKMQENKDGFIKISKEIIQKEGTAI